MTRFISALLALVVWAAPFSAAAHSLKGLGAQLYDRETFFQPVDRPAPAFSLQDAEGRTVALQNLRGKVLILNFVYTSCPDVCPLHAEKIAEVQRMVNETPMRELVRFVTITTDPTRDTPEVMRGYGPAHGLDEVNWTFLTSRERPEETRALAEAFGHRFAPATDDRMQMHGIVTHKEGRLRANFHGLDFAPINLVTFVNALTNDDVHDPGEAQAPSAWDRFKSLF